MGTRVDIADVGATDVVEKSSSFTRCLCCDSSNLEPSLDLGSQPLANEFLDSPDSPQDSYPLAVNLCQDCLHLQLTYFIDPDLMFKQYLYVSGTSETYRRYLAEFARGVFVS